MLRRKFLSSILAAILLVGSFGSIGCDKQSVLSSADDVLFSLREAQPIIAQFLPSAAPKIEQGVRIAQKLRDAVANSQSTEALGFLSDLIIVFQDIVHNDIPQLTDPGTITAILSALALANIALHYLARNLVERPAALAATPRPGAIAFFDAEPVWGHRFKYNKRK